MTKEAGKGEETIILGIDPGSYVMGYSVIRAVSKNKIELLCMDSLKLSKVKDHFQRLKYIYQSIARLIDTYNPDQIALEAPFFGKNVQSMLKLGRAQGIAMAPAILREIPIFEYPPKQVKQSITGNGNATKQQVADMLKHQVEFDVEPELLDATDALATAICHFHHSNKPESAGSYKDWKSFIKDNPDRINQ